MYSYVSLVNFTDQGVKDIRSLPDRWKGARMAIEAAGGTITYYLTMGNYDSVIITQFPSEQAGAAAALFIGFLGNVRTTTLRAFDEEEAGKIVASLPGS
jgi:uncharacterized protein with GYD domain